MTLEFKCLVGDRFNILLVGVICIIALTISGFQFLRWDLARCYEMSPWDFRKQIEHIKPGVTEKEAIGRIKGYSEIRREEDKTILIMKPKKEALIMLAIWQGITLELDEDGKVASVYSWDG